MKLGGLTCEAHFYRNLAYNCGLMNGKYTFLVIEPSGRPGSKAPLWVYLHGGGVGFYDSKGNYRAIPSKQTAYTWNHEESFKDLRRINPYHSLFKKDGQLGDNTITRRLKEGYRFLVVSYSDHDLYSGCGTPYPHNPKGGEVNGLQATMSAVEYVAAGYPTSHVFAHGTSAGSFGAYSLAFALASDGINLSGVVMDSGMFSPRIWHVNTVLRGHRGQSVRGGLGRKIGRMADYSLPFHPEAAVKAGFTSVPMLIIAGVRDGFYGGGKPPIDEARARGLSNIEWGFDGVRKAIEEQPHSPHRLVIFKDFGHVPTNKGHRANDLVDEFIRRIASASTPYPFQAKLKACGWLPSTHSTQATGKERVHD